MQTHRGVPRDPAAEGTRHLNKELPHKLCCQLSAGEIAGGRSTLQAVHAAPSETHAQQKDMDYRCI